MLPDSNGKARKIPNVGLLLPDSNRKARKDHNVRLVLAMSSHASDLARLRPTIRGSKKTGPREVRLEDYESPSPRLPSRHRSPDATRVAGGSRMRAGGEGGGRRRWEQGRNREDKNSKWSGPVRDIFVWCGMMFCFVPR